MMSRTERFFLFCAAAWTITLAVSLAWNLHISGQRQIDRAYTDAQANLNKDLSFRRWASDHGGVYVPVTETQKSVRWLSHVPGRDVTTTDGRQLTLLNPASMLRQVMDRYAKDYGVRGRIVGLKQLNPANAPDTWEHKQLEAFQRGDTQEVWEITDIDGEPYLRSLRAMMMEPGCDKCHAILGYKTGDMRGGTGVNLPLNNYYTATREDQWVIGISHFTIWLSGMLGLGMVWRRAWRSELVAATNDAERRRAATALRESEATFRKLFEDSSDPILLINSDGAFVEYNEAALTLLKMSREQLLLRTPAMISPEYQPDGRTSTEAAADMIAQAQQKELYRFDWVHINTQGEELTVNVSLMPIVLNGQPMLHTTWRDITERKQIEAALIKSEAQHRNLLQHLQVGVMVHAPDTSVQLANKEASRLLGLSLEQMQGLVAMDPAWCFVREDGQPIPVEEYPVVQAMASKNTSESFTLGIQRSESKDCVWVQGKTYTEFNERHDIQKIVVTFMDISLRKEAESSLQLAAQVFSHSQEGIIITDAEGLIVNTNDAFSRITGYSRNEAVGKNPKFLTSDHQPPGFYRSMLQKLAKNAYWSGEVWNCRKNGELYAEMLTISMVQDSSGKVQNYVAQFTDITLIKEHQQQLEHIAHYDSLTDLANRVLLADRLHQSMVQSQRRGQVLALAFLDLDGFKPINDNHGHEVGDKLLVIIANRLKVVLRACDTLARVGGDEFVAVLADLDVQQDCEPMLTRLLQAAAEPIIVGDETLHISASIGVAIYPSDGDDADQLLRHADQAMYQAKLAGKNQYHFFDAAKDSAAHAKREGLERIRHALEQQEFVLYYQPKVNMNSGTVIGAEALIRWQHPQRGLLPPAAFLPIIEDHPLSVDVGEWVINTALTQMDTWRAAGLDLNISVNVGSYQLQHGNFVDRLNNALSCHPEELARQLELEILETSALQDVDQVRGIMLHCRHFGVSFSLDDFGTGYSSLTYLKRLPASLIKIDQSFVRDMLSDPEDLAIVQGVIGLAEAFNLGVIAEGVETEAHGKLLLSLNCELAQGYGIARPMPANDLPDWIKHWQANPVWIS